MWPLAVLHGLTAGTDGWSRWMLAIDAVCVIAVALCLVWRVTAGNPNRSRLAEVVATPSLQPAPRRRDIR